MKIFLLLAKVDDRSTVFWLAKTCVFINKHICSQFCNSKVVYEL